MFARRLRGLVRLRVLCIRWLIRYVATHDFPLFAWYRIAFGVIVLATAYFGWVDWCDRASDDCAAGRLRSRSAMISPQSTTDRCCASRMSRGTVVASVVGRIADRHGSDIDPALHPAGRSNPTSRAGIASGLYVVGVAAALAVRRPIDRPVRSAARARSRARWRTPWRYAPWSSRWQAVRAPSGSASRRSPPAQACRPYPPACVRYCARLLTDTAHLQAAYSLDSVLMETVFIVGPALVSLFAALGWTIGAVLCAAALGSVGSVAVHARDGGARLGSNASRRRHRR